MRVCLLERGKAYPPGSFPRSPWGTSRNLWDPSEGLHGLLNVWEFRGLGGIVASGLGGGSLLYSNVLIRKDRSTFVREDLEQRRLGVLAGHLRGARALLRAPRGDARREALPARAPAVQRNAQDERAPRGRGAPRARVVPPEARGHVRARRRRPASRACRSSAGSENLHGLPRLTCRLCGECNFGCNYGSKDTLDFNYLSLAKLRHGVDIRTRCEAKTLAPRPGGGYAVGYVDHGEAVEGEQPNARRSPRGRSPQTGSSSAPGPSGRPSSSSRTARTSPASASASERGSAATETC